MGARQLRFISGKYQGGKYLLEEGDDVTMGRGMDAGLTLFEEMVSRHHAKFMVEKGVVTVEDLRSKNGTFVNGERIERYELTIGDRILMGTSILRLEEVQIPAPEEVDSSVQAEDLAKAESEAPEAQVAAALETVVPQDLDLGNLAFDESALSGDAETLEPESGEDESAEEESVEAESVEEEAVEEEAVEEEAAEEEAAEEEAAEDESVEDESVEDESVEDESVEDESVEDESVEAESVEAESGEIELGEIELDDIDPFADDDDDAFVPELSDVTFAGETAKILDKSIDEEAYRERWGDAPLKLSLSHPLQPSLEFLSPEQLTALQAAHNHANLNGIAEALRKDDAWIKKTITFLLRSGYLAAG